MSIPRDRILQLLKTQTRIFSTTYNPTAQRRGTRILHERLKGPSVASYYPPRLGTTHQLRRLYPRFEIIDEDEEDWVERQNVRHSRGKGNPKKKRTAAESKRLSKRK